MTDNPTGQAPAPAEPLQIEPMVELELVGAERDMYRTRCLIMAQHLAVAQRKIAALEARPQAPEVRE